MCFFGGGGGGGGGVLITCQTQGSYEICLSMSMLWFTKCDIFLSDKQCT